MGPGGLASAWEAAQAGRNVLIISNRADDFVRVQRVLLTPENKEYLASMLRKEHAGKQKQIDPLDIKFAKELVNNVTIAIKDIERYIRRRLDNLPGGRVSYQFESELSEINLKKGECTIQALRPNTKPKIEEIGGETKEDSKPRVVSFDVLIGADGARHHAADVVNNQYQSPVIKYSQIESPEHPYHCSCYLTLERKDGKEIMLPKNKFLTFRMTIPGDGEEKEQNMSCFIVFDLNSYQNNKGKKVKFGFSGEVPKELVDDIKNRNDSEKAAEKVLNYIRVVLEKRFAESHINNEDLVVNFVKTSQKHGAQKDNLKFQIFQMNLQEANKVVLEEEGNRFILVGDAYRQPNYQFGHGVNHALEHAQLVKKLISGEISLDDYSEECQKLSASITDQTSFFKKLPVQEQNEMLREFEKSIEEMHQEIQDKYKPPVR